MKPRTLLSWMLRESRGALGRFTFFVACLAVGVAAVVAIAGLAAGLDSGIRSEARQLLAADLAIESRRALPEGFDLLSLLPAGARTAAVREMVTVVAALPQNGKPGRSQLVEMKAVEPGYPFYGKLAVLPARPLAALLAPDAAVVAPELIGALGLRHSPHDRALDFRIGTADFHVAGLVSSEPDRVGIGTAFGPRVFLSMAGLERAGLIAKGSRVSYKTLIALPAGVSADRLEKIADQLRAALPANEAYRVETFRQAQPQLRESFAQVGRFLGLVALLSLFVGGIGVAQSVRAWLAGRLDAIAILKCLGLRPREVLALYLGQTALLGLIGSLIGILLGVAIQAAIPHLFGDLIPAALIRPWQPGVLLRGLGLGVGVALLFSLPPLAGLLRVPPSRVLRRDAEPLPVHRTTAGFAFLALAAGLLALTFAQTDSLLLSAQFVGALTLATAILAVAATLLAKSIGRLPRFSSIALRHGLGALARPGAATVGAIVALGLGVVTVLTMSLVERRISHELSRELPSNAPSAFLVDIQPAQWPGVRALLTRSRAEKIDSVPVVMARIASINGRPVDQIAGARRKRQDPNGRDDRNDRSEGREERGRRWALTREQRLTYLQKLPADNVVVAGKLWSDPDHGEVSLEKSFAEDLGVGLGSKLGFDVQGVPLELVVTSLRTVDWSTFGINFYLVVEPGILEQAPQQRVATARLAYGSEQHVQDLLAASYPNVTFLRIREILSKILGVLQRIGLGVRFLGGFTVLSGIAILAGAISAGSVRRGREVALLKTLGMTRRQVATAFAVEYALIGGVAGLLGAATGAALSWGVVTRGFELTWEPEPARLVLAIALTIVLSVIAGLAASLRALERRPIEVLRAE
ncbi:MAG TPA: FtsX-like permease family protein [Thermoanaerobaculia bacterium]|nr:FtsX-like permease family protein [Thermoanaerobaculia bacterium]